LADMLGYANPEEVPRTAREIVHPEDMAQTLRHVRDLGEGREEEFDSERRFLRRDGTALWVRVTTTRMVGTELLIAVVQDVDARRRAEDSVRKLSGRFLHLQDEERRRIAR